MTRLDRSCPPADLVLTALPHWDRQSAPLARGNAAGASGVWKMIGTKVRRESPAAVSRLFLVSALSALIAASCTAAAMTAAPAASGPSPQASAAPATTTSATTTPATSPADWPVYHQNNAHTGDDPSFPAFTGSMTKSWSTPLDGAVYAEPLVVNGKVIAATEGDSVYSLDPVTGVVAWHRNLGTPVPLSTLPCGNIDPLGITGTPAYDSATGSLFVVAEVTGPQHVLSALNPATGAVLWSRVVDVAGHDPRNHQQRPSLAVANGYVYIGFGGLDGDCAQYVGYVAGVPTSGSGPTISYSVPTSREGAIWAAGGPVVDGSGNIYVSVGNGASTTTFDGSDSVLELSPSLQLLNYFAPSGWAADNAGDADLGSLAPVLVPGGWVFIAGKSGTGYVLHQGALGGIGGQVDSAGVCSGFGGAAISGSTVYVPCFGSLRQVTVGSGGSLTAGWQTSAAGGSPVVGGGAVWSVNISTGRLVALNPATGATLGSISVGSVAHFISPTLWSNEVLVGTLAGVTAVTVPTAPPATPASFVPLTPSRILDSRHGVGLSGPFQSSQARTFQVTGMGGVLAGATAVTGNLTVTAQTHSGFVFLGPDATDAPSTSTLNFPIHDNRANGVTVALGPGGTLSATYVARSAATAQVIFDVTGYFAPGRGGASFSSLAPSRILDSRIGVGLSGPLHSSLARTFQVSGQGGVLAGASAVTGNLTVTRQTSAGSVFLGPNPTNSPATSTLNFPIGDNRANGVTVALGAGGTLSATFVGAGSSATVDIVFDVTGYFAAGPGGDLFVPLTPSRILDPRISVGLSGPFHSNLARTFQVTGLGGVIAGATAVTGNLTVTGQTRSGSVFLGPNPIDSPSTSTINFPIGDTRANGVTVGLGSGGTLSATYAATPGATVEVILDVTGYFAPGP